MGREKTFRLGDTVEVAIQADYYFGGPVANADVEVLVYQNPFYHYWRPPHRFPWYYEADQQYGYHRQYYGSGQIIKREKIKTDATGKASLSFETPIHQQQDLEYRIEARVTDASRREIIASNNIRVTRQRYYVYLYPDHNIYAPNKKVEVDIKALDANEEPIATEGTVTVTRDFWREIWISPEGKEVTGESLQKIRRISPVFPPPYAPGQPVWQLKFRGYERDEILKRTVTTDREGNAKLTFTPDREGLLPRCLAKPRSGHTADQG